MKSKALKANLEETRVNVEIEDKYKAILTLFDRYQGIHQELVTFLKELSNPMRSWHFIISEARKYSFDHLHLIMSDANAAELLKLFLDIFHNAIESNQDEITAQAGKRVWFQSGYLNARAAIQAEAVDYLMQFIQTIIKASDKNFYIIAPVLNQTFEHIFKSSDKILLLFSRSYYRFTKIVNQIIQKSVDLKTAKYKKTGKETGKEIGVDWKILNHLLFRYHKTTYRSWLNENDPLSWFEQEIEAMMMDRNKSDKSERAIPESVKELFAPISHKQMQNELNRLLALEKRYEDNLNTWQLTYELVCFPENSEIIEIYKSMPEQLLASGTTSRQGNHWKVLFLFHTLNIQGLSMIHINTFQEINRTLRWLIGVENAAYIQQLIRQTFTILKLRSEQFNETILDSILNMGKGVYNTGDSSLVHFFLDCVIDSGFHIPIVQGVGRDWQLRDNATHIKNLRVWLALISMNPSWSIRLISHLIIYLSVYGVLIKDTDLFPREITELLNSPIEPVYNLVKQLARLFPVYFNEIGAEGAIRDTSTNLDEICHRKDILIHFYRKRIHVESSNRIISMTEAIFNYWLTKDSNYLIIYVPEDFISQMESQEGGEFLDGVHSDMSHLKQNGVNIPSDLLTMAGSEIKRVLLSNSSGKVTSIDHERVILLITLYKLLYQKYTPSFTEINKYLEVVNTAHIPHIDKLKDALAEQTKPNSKVKWKLQQLLNYLRLLKKELLSDEKHEAREDIFKKRHVNTDIPSLYGSYHEPKFDALGLTFRLESMVNPLFEELVDELDLTLITRETVHKIRNRLQMFYAALNLDAITSTEFEFQMNLLTHSLGVQGFTFTQYLDIFQALNKAVKNIINDYFHTTHQENLNSVLDKMPTKYILAKYNVQKTSHKNNNFEIKQRVAEIFFRDRMASSLGLQQLDTLLTRIQNTLFQQAQGLPSEHLQKLLMYDPKKIITSINDPKPWVLGAMDLGNKGNNLMTLSLCELPVPPGFIITTEAFRYRELIDYYQPARYNFREQIKVELERLEATAGKKFGDPSNPLLLSVRSGSVISQPGMMDTFIDVGINEEIAEGIAANTGNVWLAWDNYRRFLQCFGMAKGLKRDAFDAIITHHKNSWGIPYKKDFTGEQMKMVALAYKEHIIQAGFPVNSSPFNQLLNAIKMVFESWDAPRAMAYRRIIGLSQDWGTSVTVQQMVFGNISYCSGTGVVLTHDPRSPRDQISLWGDFTRGSQGEDVVAGLVNTFPISVAQQEREMRNTDTTLETDFPEIYQGLMNWASELVEKRGWSPQEIEFTFESPKIDDLHILQSRDLGIRERKSRPEFEPVAKSAAFETERYMGNGIGVSGGAMSGRLVFTLEDIKRWRKLEPNTSLIMVRNDTVPDDISEIHAADGLLTARGGMTSHASIVAYRLDKTCVVGYRNMVCHETDKRCVIDTLTFSSGDFISIDGHEGAIFKGELPIVN
ncbi:MAG: pyruvate, phosphate dikinase [Desulfamplus sp.]|nr:pyruvate, phosphate dikinase [Desulfamplus sp.]